MNTDQGKALTFRHAVERTGEYVDLVFIFRFILFFLTFYYGNEFFVAIIGPGKFYSPFLQQHLNYIVWLKSAILYTAGLFSQLLGVKTFVVDLTRLKVPAGPSVYLGLKCLGVGIISFWLSFILAHDYNWKKKLYWCLIGVVSIFLLNCWRITLILFALEKNWSPVRTMDHHTTWNIATYLVIMVLVYLYYRQTKKEDLQQPS